MKRKYLITLSIGAIIMATAIAVIFPVRRTYAKTDSEYLSVTSYEFGKDSKYEISENKPSGSSEFGKVSLNGDYESLGETSDGIKQYDVKSGQLSLQYSYDSKLLDVAETAWHIYSDNTKTVDGIEIENKVENGAIIIQTSRDNKKWATDTVYTNVFSKDSEIPNPLYTTKDIQLINGCYYRIIVVYEHEMVTGTTKYWLVETKDKSYKKSANVYEFYAINSSENAQSNKDLTPKKNLGESKSMKKDSGFTSIIDTDIKNPHYGWKLGEFFVNGYTRETTLNDRPLFLKNAGDKVTLWFNLNKDIENLDGAGKYEIAEDKNGYDTNFEISKTNFKHGALIIRFTDYEGKKHDPVIYTDFLAANATTGADTQAVLFEEGDYEVALDYVIKSTDLISTENDYQIAFEFSVRNGNTMFFPFDVETGDELRNNAVTASGFYIDMAKSQYLNIDVKRSVIVENEKGHTEDVRFNRPAKDGDRYTDEGIYTVDVTNQYTNEHTTKTFYVGTNPFMVALSKNGISIAELDDYINQGYTIDENGALVAPTGSTVNPRNLADENNSGKLVDLVVSKEAASTDATKVQDNIKTKTPIEPPVIDEEDAKEKSGSAAPIIIVLCLIVVGAAVAFFFIKKDKAGKIMNFFIKLKNESKFLKYLKEKLGGKGEKKE